MRTKLVLLVLGVSFAALVLAATAAAAPGRFRLHGPTPTSATKPVPAAAIVPKTAAMLAGAAYPWVQPMWQTVDGIVIVTLPRTIVTAGTQPPAWVLSH